MTEQPYEIDEPYVNPWMPKSMPKPFSEPRWTLQSPPIEKPQLVVEHNKLFDAVFVRLSDGRTTSHRFVLK
jgi:hypothetical protein